MTIPNIDSYSPALAELRAKKAKLLLEVEQRKPACAEIRARLRSGGTPDPGNENEVRLRKLLGKPAVTESLPDGEQLNQLLSEMNVFNGGVSLLDAEILKETRVANNKFVDSVRPEITRLGSAFAKAFADLQARHSEFDEYIDLLEDAGASVGQFRIRPNGLSHPKDLSGSYAYGLQEFIEAGFFSKSNMPKVLK